MYIYMYVYMYGGDSAFFLTVDLKNHSLTHSCTDGYTNPINHQSRPGNNISTRPPAPYHHRTCNLLRGSPFFPTETDFSKPNARPPGPGRRLAPCPCTPARCCSRRYRSGPIRLLRRDWGFGGVVAGLRLWVAGAVGGDGG